MSLLAAPSTEGVPPGFVAALLCYGTLMSLFLWLLNRLFRGTVKPSTGVVRAHALARVAAVLLTGGLIVGVLYGFAVAPALRRGVDFASVDELVHLCNLYLLGLGVLLVFFAAYCLLWQRRKNVWFPPLSGLAMATTSATTCMGLEASVWAGARMDPAILSVLWWILFLTTAVSIFGWLVARRSNPSMADKQPPRLYGDDN